MTPYNIYSFVSDFFFMQHNIFRVHPHSSVYLQFLFLAEWFALYGYSALRLPILLFGDIWVVSSFALLQIQAARNICV